jgi:hypothetical protein
MSTEEDAPYCTFDRDFASSAYYLGDWAWQESISQAETRLDSLQKEYQLRPSGKLWADLCAQQKRLPEVERRQTGHDKLMDDYRKRYPGIDKLWTRWEQYREVMERNGDPDPDHSLTSKTSSKEGSVEGVIFQPSIDRRVQSILSDIAWDYNMADTVRWLRRQTEYESFGKVRSLGPSPDGTTFSTGPSNTG